jgi:putative ABC transport system permease protein
VTVSIPRLIVREVLHRKLGFALGVLALVLAIGCLVGQIELLRAHDRRTEDILAAMEAEVRARMEEAKDDYRKITKDMGFNVLILPRDQSLQDLYAEDFATKYMSEDYADRLAKSGVATINHVLPSLLQKVRWPERERTVLVMGVRGEVVIQDPSRQTPILEAVPPGGMVVGAEIHQSFHLKVGDAVKFMGREYRVSKLHPPRGTKDDITLWIDLREAQELFGKKGLINAILALECNCEADRLSKIREEITRVLPDTQVIEFASQAIARADARNRVAALARASVEKAREDRARLRGEREAFAAVLVPAALIAAGVWIAILTLANVRERRAEIGLIRALGLRSSQVVGLFLGRAVLLGLAGGLAGYLAGLALGALGRDRTDGGGWGMPLDLRLLALALLAAPVLACAASWLPALSAARQDPADVLRGS